MPRIILIGIIILGVIILGVTLSLLGLLPGKRTPPPAAVTISLWASQDTEDVWHGIIDDFHVQYPSVTVTYRKLNPDTFEDTLINALAEGTGPDMVLLPQSFIVKHHDKLFPLPQQQFNFDTRKFRNLFADAFAGDLIDKDDHIIGLPLFVDTPILFYNKDIFNAAGIAQPPKTWDEVIGQAQSLTTRSSAGDILTSGLAIGAGANVERSFEIVNSMILQNAPRPPQTQNGAISFDERTQNAVKFYTSFTIPSTPIFFWTGRLPSSFTMFAQEQAAMTFGLSSDIPRILEKNPHLNLGIAPFPQQTNRRSPVVYGQYFFPTVLKTSKNPGAAWQFALYASAGDGAKTYAQTSGRPAARRDILSARAPAPQLDVAYRQSLIAATWRVPDEKTTRRLFTEALDAIASGAAKTQDAVGKLGQQIQLLYP
ncbi:MAG: extracellular solute-binding protein [Candidatus Sungbacteria bacterium]|nr:extracellular solute-binding protein [Candidatus Sungbacteria bacterium]